MCIYVDIYFFPDKYIVIYIYVCIYVCIYIFIF